MAVCPQQERGHLTAQEAGLAPGGHLLRSLLCYHQTGHSLAFQLVSGVEQAAAFLRPALPDLFVALQW